MGMYDTVRVPCPQCRAALGIGPKVHYATALSRVRRCLRQLRDRLEETAYIAARREKHRIMNQFFKELTP